MDVLDGIAGLKDKGRRLEAVRGLRWGPSGIGPYQGETRRTGSRGRWANHSKKDLRPSPGFGSVGIAMALKYKLATGERPPAGRETDYVERDGVLVLDVDTPLVERMRLDEMRETNIKQRVELEGLQRRFAGVDPEAVRKAQAEAQRLQEEAKLKDGKFEEVLKGRLEAAQAEAQKRLADLQAERDQFRMRIEANEIDAVVTAAAVKRGLVGTAMSDLQARARAVFRFEGRSLKAVGADGKPLLGKDGNPLQPAGWVETLAAEAPHLFAGSAGAGAAGGASGGGSGSAGSNGNPFRKETWNLTEQMRVMRSDPKRAEQLKAAAAS